MNILLPLQDRHESAAMTLAMTLGRDANRWPDYPLGSGRGQFQAYPYSTALGRNELRTAANFPYQYQSIGAVVRGVGGR